MTTKRRNLGDLNSDNWNEEDAPEDRGTFRKASDDEIKNRVIKTARRRVAPATDSMDAPPPGIFSGFGGFSKTPTAPAGMSSPFTFLSKTTSSPAITSTNGPPKISSTQEKKSPETSAESDYHGKLIDLNKSLLEWVKGKIEKNPLVILTPIFDDYEKHLKEIKSGEEKTSQSSLGASSGTALKGFSLGVTSTATLTGFSSTATASAGGFGSKTATTTTFGGANLTASASTGFSFGATKPFTFGNVTKPTSTETTDKETKAENEDGEEENDEPPKVSFTPVVEEDSVFSKRCKVFIKNDDGYKERGVGTLYLKSVSDGKKIQMIVRADTSLGNVLVNLMLTKGIPVKILGKNNVMMVCIPSGDFDKPVSMLLKVKTPEEAEDLFNAIEKYATD